MLYFRTTVISILALAAITASIAQTPRTTDSPQLIESRELTSKVVKFYGERKYDEALQLAKHALELAESALGSKDSRLISPLINLGDLYVATIHFDNAITLFEGALCIVEEVFATTGLRLTSPLTHLR